MVVWSFSNKTACKIRAQFRGIILKCIPGKCNLVKQTGLDSILTGWT